MMDFIHFGDTIFKKADFQSARIEKDTITVFFQDADPLIKKCENETEAKGLMRELLRNLNQSND